jgi:hypothetical protein
MRGFVVCILCLAGCDSTGGRRGNGDLAGRDAGSDADGGAMSCTADQPDQTGCSCVPGESRACWPSSARPSARGVGACKDGTQACNDAGELSSFGPCLGAMLPSSEICTNGIDDDCSGATDCADAACATDPACRSGCTDGDTRPCYTGPSGTENVGTCRDGMQVCAGGMWPSTCAGEVLPATEDCSDALDHNCNHLPGCLDLFACITSPACMSTCTTPDTGCVCPQGAGDTATCPEGMHGVTVGGSLTSPGMTECCPCTGSDCGDPSCCAETVCAGNSACSGVVCAPLPSSCNGQVNADCDDFPEDCDEPCCPCRNCP